MKKLFLLFVAFVATTTLWAHDFEVDGIYYNYLEGNNVEVTYRGGSSDSYDNEYSGAVSIPSTVTYNGTTYSVTSIRGGAFYSCSSLTSITIPNSVTSIGDRAFESCSSLTSITIPNSVTSIGNRAFASCSSLTSLTIPNSVTSIESDAFSNCSSLTSITIPNSVTSIELQAFWDCSALTSVTIPNSVKSIEEAAFAGCDSLTSMVVEGGNATYDSRNNCNAIIETATNTLIAGCQNTIIPNSVTSIGSSAFYDCSSLTSITIPNSVTSIEGSAFWRCSSLTTITIPNSVTSIGEYAFSYCESLRTVICEAVEIPELESDVFSKTPITEATLYVPAQSLDDYKAADQWKDFGTILPLEEAPSAVENTRLPIANGAKLLRDGQIIILRDGKTYTIMGAQIQ